MYVICIVTFGTDQNIKPTFLILKIRSQSFLNWVSWKGRSKDNNRNNWNQNVNFSRLANWNLKITYISVLAKIYRYVLCSTYVLRHWFFFSKDKKYISLRWRFFFFWQRLGTNTVRYLVEIENNHIDEKHMMWYYMRVHSYSS